jgi:hypothetical protein
MFFRAVAHNAGYFSALWTTVQKNDDEIHHRKMVAVVGNNAEKSLNSNISTNLKPNANLHWGFNTVPRLMCFMKKSRDEKSRGNVPLNFARARTIWLKLRQRTKKLFRANTEKQIEQILCEKKKLSLFVPKCKIRNDSIFAKEMSIQRYFNLLLRLWYWYNIPTVIHVVPLKL